MCLDLICNYALSSFTPVDTVTRGVKRKGGCFGRCFNFNHAHLWIWGFQMSAGESQAQEMVVLHKFCWAALGQAGLREEVSHSRRPSRDSGSLPRKEREAEFSEEKGIWEGIHRSEQCCPAANRGVFGSESSKGQQGSGVFYSYKDYLIYG